MFCTEFRRRWRAWLILVVLIVLVGGLVLAAAAAGRRTASAFPRFVAAHGYDFDIFNLQPLPGLAKLSEVASVTMAGEALNGNVTCVCKPGINSSNLSIVDLSPTALQRVVKLVAGQMPTQSSSDDVLASFNLQQDYGVHIGTVIHTPFYTSSQVQAVIGGANLTPAGPTVASHVVGIEAAESEFPSGQSPTYDLYATQAFARTVGQRAALGTEYLVHLRYGATDLARFSAEVTATHAFSSEYEEPIATAVTASIHPQAVGWWVLALLAGLAGLAVIGQALGRQSAVESEECPTLAALGLPGTPLGVAVGQAVWRAFATNLGAVPVSTVPVWVIAALGAGVLVVANLLAIAPALAAARSKTAGHLLRTQ